MVARPLTPLPQLKSFVIAWLCSSLTSQTTWVYAELQLEERIP